MMAAKGYVNDRRFAEGLVYNYAHCKLYGPKRVRQELFKRGIRGRVADEAVESCYNGLCDRLEALIEKKYAGYLEDPEDLKSVNKAKNGLVRAGYDYDDINKAIKDFLEK